MAWLKVSFPSVSMEAEALFRRGRACLADALFAERGSRGFFTKGFLAVCFFTESSVDIASTERCKYRRGVSTSLRLLAVRDGVFLVPVFCSRYNPQRSDSL